MIKAVIAGLGNMGRSHALALHKHPDVEVIGLVNRSDIDLPRELAGYPLFRTFEEGLALSPDLMVIATYTDTHVD